MMSYFFKVTLASFIMLSCFAMGVTKANNLDGVAGLFGALIQQAQQNKAQRQNDFVAIQRLQTSLRRLGLYGERIDGHWGGTTSAAVIAFYHQSNRPAPEQITMQTVSEIESAANRVPATRIVPVNDSPGQSSGPSFNCAGNLNATERTICGSAELSNLDRQMLSTYGEAVSQVYNLEQDPEFKNSARQFLVSRNACGSSADCIRSAYQSRTSELDFASPASDDTSNHTFVAIKGFDANLQLQNGRTWIIVASRQNLSDALILSDDYAENYDSSMVMRSPKGPFAVTIGWIPKDLAIVLLGQMKASGLIPSDSFLSSGEGFAGPIFMKPKPNANSRDLLMLLTMLRPSVQGLSKMQATGSSIQLVIDFSSRVGGLNPTDDYIGMRSQPDPSRKPRYLLPHGTLLEKFTENGDWLQVQTVSGISGWIQKSYIKPLSYLDGHDSNAPQMASTQPAKEQVANTPIPLVFDQTQKDEIRKQAVLLLSDIDAYLKTDPKINDVSSVAEMVGQVRKFQTTEDYESLQGVIYKLKEKAVTLVGYSDFYRKREVERRESDARALESQVSEAKGYVFFMQSYIKSNITADAATQMATLLKRYDESLKSPSLTIVTSLNDESKALVSRSGLDNAYKEKMASFAPSDDGATARSLGEMPIQFANGIARPVFMGDDADFVVLYNDTSLAPNVIKNLKGEFEFSGGRAKICTFYPISDLDIHRGILAYVTGKGAPSIDFNPSPCNESQFMNYDLLIGQRKQILALSQHYMLPVLKLMEDGKLKFFSTATQPEITTAARFTKYTLVALESDILAGAKSGFGLVRVENASSTICAIIAGDAAPHQAALKAQSAALVEAIGNQFNWAVMDADHTFVSAKKRECGAAYGDAKSLGVLMQGLRRDGISYHMAPLWIDDSTIAAQRELIANAQQDEIRIQAEKQRQLDDAQKLTAAKVVDVAAQKVIIEKKLRDENGPRARSKTDGIRESLNELATGKQTWTGTVFPDFATWYKQQIADHWELVTIETSVHDFGSAKWKDRTLESAFADAHVTMKNRILGETKDFCWILGGIDDSEYQIERAPVAVQCEGVDSPLERWSLENGFVSQWVAPSSASN